jgi:hypothetical protein
MPWQSRHWALIADLGDALPAQALVKVRRQAGGMVNSRFCWWGVIVVRLLISFVLCQRYTPD